MSTSGIAGSLARRGPPWYIGRVTTVEANYGFIGIDTVRREDDSTCDIGTTKDVFVHAQDLTGHLKRGVTLRFQTAPDERRTGGLRAMFAKAYEPLATIVSPFDVRDEPGTFDQDLVELLSKELYDRNPKLHSIITDWRVVNFDMRAEDVTIKEYASKYEHLGMRTASDMLQRDYNAFTGMRQRLAGLTRGAFPKYGFTATQLKAAIQMAATATSAAPLDALNKALQFLLANKLPRNALQPIADFPAIFAAFPVWFAVPGSSRTNRQIKYVPGLNANAQNLLGLFNISSRAIGDYRGGHLPIGFLGVIVRAKEHFDSLFLVTADYERVSSERGMKPAIQSLLGALVIGFKTGLPFAFVLGAHANGTEIRYESLVKETLEQATTLSRSTARDGAYEQFRAHLWALRASGDIAAFLDWLRD